MSGSPMSPACRMCSTPSKAVNTSGRSSPCVSEMMPISTLLLLQLRPLAAAPARRQRVLHLQVVENAGDDEVDEVVDAARAVVEAGRGREDHRAGAGEPGHVLEVDERKRGLAG